MQTRVIPSSHLTVLEAMTRPDLQPPDELDSPALAIHRRLPELAPTVASAILHDLNALGLTDVPYIEGMLNPGVTADLTTWITEEGWKALGLETGTPEN